MSQNPNLQDMGVIAFRLDCTLANGHTCKPQAWITPASSPFGKKILKDEKSGFYLVAVKPSQYKWKRIHFTTKAGFSETVMQLDLPAFDVNLNEVNYLGDFHLVFKSKNGTEKKGIAMDTYAPLILLPFADNSYGELEVEDKSEEAKKSIQQYFAGKDYNYKFVTNILSKK
jgi:hypothetical protein